MAESQRDNDRQAAQLVRAFTAAIATTRGAASPPTLTVNQSIYADETSYVGQQREAARQFKQIARAL